jgi:hypothetical protein
MVLLSGKKSKELQAMTWRSYLGIPQSHTCQWKREELAETIKRPKSKRTAALMSFDIGIAEGGARTHDLEVDLFAVIRATRSTD